VDAEETLALARVAFTTSLQSTTNAEKIKLTE
jgi:hypothetical protein